jgi:hypothetical protein
MTTTVLVILCSIPTCVKRSGMSCSQTIYFEEKLTMKILFETVSKKANVSLVSTFLVLTVYLTVQAQAQSGSTNIIRPPLAKSRVEGSQIAKPGSYSAKVGDLLELEYSYPVIPEAMPTKLDAKSSDSTVLSSDSDVKTVVVPGLMGAGKKAFWFSAKSPGKCTITLSIDGNQYVYSISVENGEEDSTKPDLCRAVYTAIQFKGKVFIFANGVHPTAGFKTYFEKANIAVWPPRYSLMCESPSGSVAQVLTPYSVQTSFEAAQPVESVIITDSDGTQTLKVIRLK